MKLNKNILIVSQAEVGQTETFIKAHIERLSGNIYLYGYYLRYYEGGISLREKYQQSRPVFLNRLLNFLPYYIVFRINKIKKARFSDFNLVKRYLLDNNINVVLAEYGTTGAFITPVCKSLDIPLIVHFHGFDASRYDILEKYEMEYKAMFEYASKIIGVSKRMINDLKNMGCPEDKLVLNPYGPNPKFFEAKPDYHSQNIIAIGRQTYKKAPYLSILSFYKAWQQNMELHLHFVGDGEIEEVSKNMVKALGLDQNVHFHGIKTSDEITKLMNQSFLFIQHSIIAANGDSEGTPVGVLEAMAAGLPVIATKHAGITDVVEEGKTGFLVDELDIMEMSEKISMLALNKTLVKKMGEAARQRVLDYFTIEQHIGKIKKEINLV
jgi:glycosyltransferase involved in cell wall biosynthesis